MSSAIAGDATLLEAEQDYQVPWYPVVVRESRSQPEIGAQGKALPIGRSVLHYEDSKEPMPRECDCGGRTLVGLYVRLR